MEIKVHKDYERINKENIELFRKYDIKEPEKRRYRCVICGEPCCIGDSISRQGKRMMHTGCMARAFGYGKFREAFKWMEEGIYDSDNQTF